MTATDQATPAAAAERYWRNTVFAVFAITVARLAWLALGKADLYADEKAGFDKSVTAVRGLWEVGKKLLAESAKA